MPETWPGHGDDAEHLPPVMRPSAVIRPASVREVLGTTARPHRRSRRAPVMAAWVVAVVAAAGAAWTVRDALFASPGTDTARSVWSNPGRRADELLVVVNDDLLADAAPVTTERIDVTSPDVAPQPASGDVLEAALDGGTSTLPPAPAVAAESRPPVPTVAAAVTVPVAGQTASGGSGPTASAPVTSVSTPAPLVTIAATTSTAPRSTTTTTTTTTSTVPRSSAATTTTTTTTTTAPRSTTTTTTTTVPRSTTSSSSTTAAPSPTVTTASVPATTTANTTATTTASSSPNTTDDKGGGSKSGSGKTGSGG